MKKILLIILLFLAVGVNAVETKETIINEITNTETYTNEVLDILIDLSNNHKNEYNKVLTSELINSFTDDISSNIDKILNKLDGTAKTDLSNKKTTIVNKLTYIRKTYYDIYDFLNKYRSNLTLGDNGVILSKFKSYLNNVKPKANTLFNIYNDLIYDEVLNITNTFKNIDEIDTYYNEQLSRLDGVLTLFNDLLIKYQDIYTSFDLNAYGITFDDTINKLQNDFNTFYNKYETKLTKILNDKITTIVNNTNEENIESIVNRNKQLYDLMDKIYNIRNKASNKFTSINNKITITELNNKLITNQNKVLNKLDKTYTDVKIKILNIGINLQTKKENDTKYTIESNSKIVKYKSKELDANTFINNLTTYYGNIEIINKYNNNIGTNSKIQIKFNNIVLEEYVVVVNSDVNSDGKISALDYVKVKNNIMKYMLISDTYEKLAADANNDNKITALDYVSIKNQIMEAK